MKKLQNTPAALPLSLSGMGQPLRAGVILLI